MCRRGCQCWLPPVEVTPLSVLDGLAGPLGVPAGWFSSSVHVVETLVSDALALGVTEAVLSLLIWAWELSVVG